MSHIDFDNFTEDYNKLLNENTKFFSSDEAYFCSYKVDIVKRIIKNQPFKILEYGCGIGRNIPFLKMTFNKAVIFGSDISQKSIEIARKNNPDIEFWNDTDLSSQRVGFDFIFVSNVYHHIPLHERLNVTKKLFHMLSPGGELIIFEHNPYNPITRRIVNTCPYDEDAILLPAKELRYYIKAANFQLQKQGYALFFPPILKKLSKLERYMEYLPLGGQYWTHVIRE